MDPVAEPVPPVEPVVARLRRAGCVFAEDEARLLTAAADGARLAELVARRAAGEPLEHLLGHVEFDGLRVAVTGGVFVPRRRTEALVHAAAALTVPGTVVVDLCCGCGAIGLAVVRRAAGAAWPARPAEVARPAGVAHPAEAAPSAEAAQPAAAWSAWSGAGPVELHAADVDPVATACAATNLAGVGTVHTGDLFDALPGSLRGRVGVLVANTPYVPADAIAGMPPEARDHEPRLALDGGTDGLDPARRVAAGAAAWLAPGGTVLIETGAAQAPVLAEELARHGLRAEIGSDDDRDATWVTGCLTRTA
ncbi:class I SAM-dependent methyltransferase [Pseudonocardia phyllosphaerae]|uniref:putative protein N(5)-glutamine methyltransferase n=1 Tax=Pseudonocardia phyllosphaerae TaxID=3390502 RepID=UPI0039793890